MKSRRPEIPQGAAIFRPAHGVRWMRSAGRLFVYPANTAVEVMVADAFFAAIESRGGR